MPFDARVGNEMTYQAAKPTNWQPGMMTFDVGKEETFFYIHFRRLHTRRTRTFTS
jgi:hypothetical protein